MMARNPNWWSVNGMHPQSHQLSSSSPFLYVSSSSSSAATDSSTANPSQEFPVRSWSQLLLSGLAGTGEEERFGGSLFQQQKKVENWEDHVLNPSLRDPVVDVKQEVAQTSQLYGHVDEEFQVSRSSCWPQIIPVSSPTSCITSSSNNILNFSGAKVDHDRKTQLPDHSSECNSTSTGGVSKKPKVQQSSTQPALKVRKEKLGDRITALHQLVSPFGKTDTASVLTEAIGYIRFLQGQIEALSSPYMRNATRSMGHQQSVQERDCLFPEESSQFLNDVGMEGKGASEENSEDEEKDLRSKGLCLVPVSCTQHVGNDINGADYWAPALGGGF
ncbi:transcription factor bHLH68-like isoform X1 [Olea europaea var. sylvestris]|uniref:transcription factor bHLH68-like isoform X1 n=1 Tax=Olea europaea var. sylvestris TaxID=158386 RepID=UPI000C1D74CB|nr:transcription factor bHLH68-like isoform X1 [Olea europaea var. sylvestris]